MGRSIASGMMRPFLWRKAAHQADNMHYAERGPFHMHAWDTGEWKVMRDTTVLIHHGMQSKGVDQVDAQRRAQAATMILLQLQTPTL